MLSIGLQCRILRDHWAGRESTPARKYRYSIQWHPLAAVHTWIVRQDKSGGEWEWVQPLDERIRLDAEKRVYVKEV